MARRRYQRRSEEFKRMVVERMKQCDNILALSEELQIGRRQMYKWRDEIDPRAKGELPPEISRESRLLKEVSQLKRVLADKTVELDFFKGALQKVEDRRRQSEESSRKASTTKSGK